MFGRKKILFKILMFKTLGAMHIPMSPRSGQGQAKDDIIEFMKLKGKMG